MEELLKQIVARLDRMETGQQTIREEVSNMSSQLDENTAIIKAIRHNQEFANAKLDGLVVSTVSKESLTNLATKEDIAVLAANFEVLNARLFQNEVEVQRLKAVK